MPPNRLAFGAALVRLALAFFAIAILPTVYPPMAAHRWLFAAYGAIAALQQFLIWKNIGGQWRVLLGGILDMALITFVVQRAGTARTMLVALYFVVGIINSLVSGPKMGVILSVVGSVMFAGVVGFEVIGALPYAPDGPEWAHAHAPTAASGGILVGVVALLLMLTTSIVAMLVTRVIDRETQLLEVNERLAELTRKDPLTKLFNRRYILQNIDQGLAWLNRGRPMAVVMIDLDQFKRINDARGHLDGDELLRRISEALQNSTREVDIAGRYGGDEFVVVLPDTSHEQGRIAGNRFVDAIRQVGLEFDRDHPVTGSAGLSIARPGDSVAEVLKRADQHAYAAKRLGGDRLYG